MGTMHLNIYSSLTNFCITNICWEKIYKACWSDFRSAQKFMTWGRNKEVSFHMLTLIDWLRLLRSCFGKKTCLSWSAQASITRYHIGWFKQQAFIFHPDGDWKSQIGVSARSVLQGLSRRFADGHLVTVSSRGLFLMCAGREKRGNQLFDVSSYKGTNLIMRGRTHDLS